MTTTRQLLIEAEDKLDTSLSKVYNNIQRDLSNGANWSEIQTIHKQKTDDIVRAGVTSIYEISARKTVEKDVRVPYFLTQSDLQEIKRLTQKYQDAFWISLSREITARDSLGVKSYYDPKTLLLVRKEDRRFRQGFISRISSSIRGEVSSSAVLSKSRQVISPRANTGQRVAKGFRSASLSKFRQAAFSEPHLVWRLGEGENNSCQQCSALDGTAWLVDDPSIMQPVSDTHPRCLLPDNKVIIPDVVCATKSFYNGPVVEITLEDGSRLATTKNHMILTGNGGYMPAYSFTEGMQICTAGEHVERIVSSINPDYDYSPTRIDEIFNSLKMSFEMSSMSMPATSEDFYGDGRRMQGDIDIVYPSRFLYGDRLEQEVQCLGEFNSNGGSVSFSHLSPSSVSFLDLDRYGLASHSVMSVIGQSHPFFRTHSLHSNKSTLSQTSGLNSSLQEPQPKASSSDTRLGSEFLLRFASDITVKKITQIRHFNYSGHVYDLEASRYHLYISNSFLVKNCSCSLELVDAEQDGEEGFGFGEGEASESFF